MSVAPLKSDPALAEDEAPAPGSVEHTLDQTVWLAYQREFMRAADEAVRDEVAKINANYRAAQREQPTSQPRATDPDNLDGDYEMIGTRQAYEFGE